MGIEDRPNFLEFFDELADYMRITHSDFSCFYGYGSVFNLNRKSCSDLDGGIISCDIITDKSRVFDISSEMNRLANKRGINPVKIQFNFLDKKTSEDGRFLSYDITYTTFLKKYGMELFGTDFLKNLKGIDNRFGELESTAFNFRGARNDFLMSSFYIEDTEECFNKINKSIKLLKFLPQKIKELRIISENYNCGYDKILAEEVYCKSRPDFLRELPEIIPQVDLSIYEEISQLGLHSLEDLCRDKKQFINFWGRVLGTHEQIIEAYIEDYPPKKVYVETLI